MYRPIHKFPGKMVQSSILLLVLAVLGLWGQTHGLHLIYGAVFLFGSIFLLVILRIYGILWASIITLLVNIAAIVYYDQPLIILLTSIEVLFIGMILRNKDRNMVAWDALFWILIGAPIIAILYHINSDVFSINAAHLHILKEIANGLFNVLIADIIAAYFPFHLLTGEKKINHGSIFYKHILFHFSIAVVVSPFFLYIIGNSWYSIDSIMQNAKHITSNKAHSIEQELRIWNDEERLKLQLQGLIQVANLQEIILQASDNPYMIIVTNEQDSVLASSYNEVTPKDTYIRLLSDDFKPLSDNFYQLDTNRDSSYMTATLANEGYYIYHHSITHLPFHIYVKVPIHYFQNQMVRNYTYQFHILLLFAMIAASFSTLLNRILIRSLTKKLATSTTGLPEKLKHQQSIDWPRSNIYEIKSLITNFKHMSENLARMFHNIHTMNTELQKKTTELQLSEERLQQLAYYDVLTDLPNRIHFTETLQVMLSEASNNKAEVAVLFIDLNQFKQINDTLGHAAGDLLLKKVSDKFKTLVSQQCKVFRLGGDEFVITLYPVSSNEIEQNSLEALKLFTEPILLLKQSFYITASIGISIFPQDGEDADTILKNADMAMYAAKEDGGNSIKYYNPAMNEAISESTLLGNGMRQAMLSNQFLLYYQPKVDGRSGQICGMEALLRWIHPEMGLIPPNKFIPLAEETGLIIQIDEWVLKAACSQNKQWQNQGYPKIPVAVNISAKHFFENHLYSKIEQILQETRLEPQYLRLEITEGIFIKNIHPVITVIKQLKELGVYISIDDFGTGYSSLNQLQMLPIYDLKIDQSFIRDITSNTKKEAIVKTIIELAHRMDIKVIAEGVETQEELQFLLQQHCDEIQGYLFSKPLPEDEFALLLKTNSASFMHKMPVFSEYSKEDTK